MAEDIIQFQAGREARVAGRRRDGRRSTDWLEGWDQVENDIVADAVASLERARIVDELERRGALLLGAMAPACPDCGSFDHFECGVSPC